MEIKFPVTGLNFKMALPDIFCVSVFFITAYWEGYYLLSIITAVIFAVYFLYSKIDYYVPKKLVKNEAGIFLHYLWFRKRLDPEKLLVYYDNVSYWSKYTQEYALVLYIDRNRILNTVWRNKVRLSVLRPEDPELQQYMDAIEQLWGHKVI